MEEIRVCGWAELYEQLFADARHPKLGRIDSTYSPFVALHFATARMEAFGRDGLVWIVDYVPAQERADGAPRGAVEAEDECLHGRAAGGGRR